jgi:hypothetical protein
MEVKWRKLILKASAWILLEVSLSYLGLDNMADYSEFVFERNLIVFSA